MQQLINQLIDMGMGRFMENSRQELAASDEIYTNDRKDEAQIEKRCEQLGLTSRQKMVVTDYVCCVKSADSRYADISYMAGIRDAVQMFAELGLLKNSGESMLN